MRIGRGFLGTAFRVLLAVAASAALPARNIHANYDDGRRLPSADSPKFVEELASNPAEMLDCLARHRITPLACKMRNNTELTTSAPRSPPPPAQECGIGSASMGAVCFYGRGRCAYDAVKGWFCRCGVPRQVARGVHRTESFALAPSCIDE